MTTAKHWAVDVYIGEHDESTYAQARLHTDADTSLSGTGEARLHPADTNIPEIGDELAAARALADLGHRLLATAADDIGAVVGRRVRLTE
ncbi:dsRBD fold-containing protein [Dactylosporangium sp. CA-052675]|uniref:dsRBD fold-containing protein n=1 Tax=Dactylosporangium sp. CA-052675 TaxID=3239927 RepID=UPI003D8D963E